jgi:hypothetical protein
MSKAAPVKRQERMEAPEPQLVGASLDPGQARLAAGTSQVASGLGGPDPRSASLLLPSERGPGLAHSRTRMASTLHDMKMAKPSQDDQLIASLVGTAAYRQESSPFHDGRVHFVYLPPLLSDARAKAVYEAALEALEAGVPEGWIVLPGSRLLRAPRQITVIVPGKPAESSAWPEPALEGLVHSA